MKTIYFFIAVLFSSPLLADSAVPASFKSLVDTSDVVVSGSIKSGKVAAKGYIYEIDAGEVFKGNAPKSVQVDEFVFHKLRIGGQYLFFLSHDLPESPRLVMEFDEEATDKLKGTWLRYHPPFDYLLPQSVTSEIIYLETKGAGDYYSYFGLVDWDQLKNEILSNNEPTH